MITKRRDSITALDIYAEGSLPEITGTWDQYTNCANAMNYKPFDVSNLQSDVNKQFETLISNAEEDIRNINGNLNTLDDDWGSKYISIEGKGLDIVRVEVFSKYLNKVTKEIEKNKEKCEKLISQIVTGTENVNSYLESLNKNYQQYLQEKENLKTAQDNLSKAQSALETEQAKEKPDASTISRLNSDINKFSGEVDKYQDLVNVYELYKIEEPEGQWVVG